MKRTRGLGVVVATVALLLAVSFAAGAAKYEDGTYLGFSDADRHGYIMAIVTIENDQITAVILQEMQYTGLPKDESYPWPQFHEAMQVLPQRFIEANGPDIDGYTGATGTVNKAKQAVARALDKALVDKGPRKYQDGTFYGISTDREHSTGVAWVTIENDKIVKVEVDEFLEDGSWKDWPNYPWPQAYEAMAVYEQRFVEAQDWQIDTISQATGSGIKYMQAVRQALEYARRQ